MAKSNTRPQNKPSRKRSRAILRVLKSESQEAASPEALSRHARKSAEERGPKSRRQAAQKAVKTKGKTARKKAAKKAARTRKRKAA